MSHWFKNLNKKSTWAQRPKCFFLSAALGLLFLGLFLNFNSWNNRAGDSGTLSSPSSAPFPESSLQALSKDLSREEEDTVNEPPSPLLIKPDTTLREALRTYFLAASEENRARLKAITLKLWENDRDLFNEKMRAYASASTLLLTLVFEDSLSPADVESHLTWVQSLVAGEGPDILSQRSALEALLEISERLEGLDPQSYRQIAQATIERFDNPDFDHLLPRLGQTYARYFPEEVADLFEVMPGGKETEQALPLIMSVLAVNSPDHGFQLLESESVFSTCFFLNEEDAQFFETELASDDPDRRAAVEADLSLAMTEVRDKATEAFLKGIARQDPAAALRELHRVENKEKRERLRTLFQERL